MRGVNPVPRSPDRACEVCVSLSVSSRETQHTCGNRGQTETVRHELACVRELRTVKCSRERASRVPLFFLVIRGPACTADVLLYALPLADVVYPHYGFTVDTGTALPVGGAHPHTR